MLTRNTAGSHEQNAMTTAERSDRESAATRGLIVALAATQGQLRSLARGSAEVGPTPGRTAARDQLTTHEGHLLRALHRRHLAFRALPPAGDELPRRSRSVRETW